MTPGVELEILELNSVLEQQRDHRRLFMKNLPSLLESGNNSYCKYKTTV